MEALAADFGLARSEMIKNEDQLEESETMKAREINSMIRYTMWSVFKKVGQLDDPPLETADATVRAIDRATKRR